MNSSLWTALGLRPARLDEIECEFGPFEPEFQPPLGALALFDSQNERERTRRMVAQLRAQEPVERIVNALLLSAIHTGARRLMIVPDERGVRVLLLVGECERQHLQLPTATLAPLVEKLRSMAALDAEAREGRFRMSVAQQDFLLRVCTQHTPWGERVEVAFALGS